MSHRQREGKKKDQHRTDSNRIINFAYHTVDWLHIHYSPSYTGGGLIGRTEVELEWIWNDQPGGQCRNPHSAH